VNPSPFYEEGDQGMSHAVHTKGKKVGSRRLSAGGGCAYGAQPAILKTPHSEGCSNKFKILIGIIANGSKLD
jgi:hypothetical protein